MIVSFSLMRRREDVSAEEFQRHWLDPHGPLVCKFPRLRRYSQNHVIGSRATISPLGRNLRIDGFAELAYDSDADQEAATGSPEMAACDKDSPLFIGAVLRVVTEARPVMPRPVQAAGMAKQITVFTGGAAASQSLLSRFADAAGRAAGIAGYVENLALRQRGPRSVVPVLDVAIDAIVELWFESEAMMERAVADLDAAAGGQAASYAVAEHRFI